VSELERGSLWLDQAVGHHVEGNLTADEAALLTAKIKSYVGVTWVLIAEAHTRRAHKALGYATWADYVEAEFDISRSRSYQLISQARVVLEISEAVSTDVDISEAMARDLRPVLDEAVAAAVEATESLPTDATTEDKSAAVTEALDKLRATAVEASRPKATQTHTVTEKTTTTFDPETGEILTSGEEGPPPAASCLGAEGEVPSPSSPVPPVDPALRLMADLSGRRAEVAKWLAFDRHEQVIDSMTTEQRADYRSFLLSVFNHASATLDYLDAPARLKAVN
jgi:hypothetical protein